MSLTWLSAAMVAKYKREHVVNIGKLTMNMYFLKGIYISTVHNMSNYVKLG